MLGVWGRTHVIAFMQHVTFYTGKCQHSVHIGLNVGGSFLALRKQCLILHRYRTSGGLNLTYPTQGSQKSAANCENSASFCLVWLAIRVWHMPSYQ